MSTRKKVSLRASSCTNDREPDCQYVILNEYVKIKNPARRSTRQHNKRMHREEVEHSSTSSSSRSSYPDDSDCSASRSPSVSESDEEDGKSEEKKQCPDRPQSDELPSDFAQMIDEEEESTDGNESDCAINAIEKTYPPKAKRKTKQQKSKEQKEIAHFLVELSRRPKKSGRNLMRNDRGTEEQRRGRGRGIPMRLNKNRKPVENALDSSSSSRSRSRSRNKQRDKRTTTRMEREREKERKRDKDQGRDFQQIYDRIANKPKPRRTQNTKNRETKDKEYGSVLRKRSEIAHRINRQQQKQKQEDKIEKTVLFSSRKRRPRRRTQKNSSICREQEQQNKLASRSRTPHNAQQQQQVRAYDSVDEEIQVAKTNENLQTLHQKKKECEQQHKDFEQLQRNLLANINQRVSVAVHDKENENQPEEEKARENDGDLQLEQAEVAEKEECEEKDQEKEERANATQEDKDADVHKDIPENPEVDKEQRTENHCENENINENRTKNEDENTTDEDDDVQIVNKDQPSQMDQFESAEIAEVAESRERASEETESFTLSSYSTSSTFHQAHQRQQAAINALHHTNVPPCQKHHHSSSASRKSGRLPMGTYAHLDPKLFHWTMTQEQVAKIMNLSTIPMYRSDQKGYIEYEPGLIVCQKFVLIDILGRGTFSKVFEAHDIVDQTKCAIKVIRNTHRYIEAAKTELRLLQHITNADDGSSGCIHLKDHFSWNNHPCFVFKLYGPSIYTVMSLNRFRPFPDSIVRSLTYQICKAIQFIHHLGIIFTDLKPENMVFVDGRTHHIKLSGETHAIPLNTRIKIVDFGSAVYEPRYDPNFPKTWKFKDGYNYLIQTRHYRAPEVVLEMPWKRPVDVWSVGCVILEFLHGSMVFNTHCPIDHLNQMQKVIGTIPRELIRCASDEKYKQLFHPDGTLCLQNSRRSRVQAKRLAAYFKLNKLEHRQLYDLVSRCLKWRANERIPGHHLLKHEYFKEK